MRIRIAPFVFGEIMLIDKSSNNQISDIAINLLISESSNEDTIYFFQFGISLLFILCFILMPVSSIALYCCIIFWQIEINAISSKSLLPFIANIHRLQALFYDCFNVRPSLTRNLVANHSSMRVMIHEALVRTESFSAIRTYSALELLSTMQTCIGHLRTRQSIISPCLQQWFSLQGCIPAFIGAMNARTLRCCVKWFLAVSTEGVWPIYVPHIGALTAFFTLNTQPIFVRLIAAKELRRCREWLFALGASFICHYFSRPLSSRYFCNAQTSSPLNDLRCSCALLRKASTLSAGIWTVIFSFVGCLFIPALYHKNAGMSFLLLTDVRSLLYASKSPKEAL